MNTTANTYSYFSDWGKYAYPADGDVTLDSGIKSAYKEIDLSGNGFDAAGVPILVDGGKAYLNAQNENMLIFGETGSKKSRCVIAPLIAVTAGAGESAFVTDVKGELYSNTKLRGYLKERGVKTVCLDFRTFSEDGFNILEYPFELYKSGDTDKAITECSKLLTSLAQKFSKNDDPIWSDRATNFLQSIIELMFVLGKQSKQYGKVNMITLSMLANMKNLSKFRECMSESKDYNRTLMELMTPAGYSGFNELVMNPAEKMVGSILGFVQSIIQPFMSEPKLANMLSQTTFDIDSMYRQPTCVFVIVPDETSAYDMISGLLIDSFYTRLVQTYSLKYMNRRESPCRINFICDEFCNLKVNDMKAKISASRGRNMRWFLVCQSKNQLETTYGENAGTIIGNCRNTLFLQSSDTNLLSYISEICGETMISERGSEPLVTPKMLRSLRKTNEYKEALFIDGNVVYFARLPDIDSYGFLMKYGKSKRRIRRTSNKKPKLCSMPYFTLNDIQKTLYKICYLLLDTRDFDEDECNYDSDDFNE